MAQDPLSREPGAAGDVPLPPDTGPAPPEHTTHTSLLPPSWYDAEGDEHEAVVAGRVRLARNAADLPFPDRLAKQDAARLLASSERFFRKLSEDHGGPLNPVGITGLDEQAKALLREKSLVPADFGKATQRLFLSTDETIGVMVNREDHFHLYTIESTADLTRLLVRLRLIEDELEQQTPFAVNLEWGYLSARLSNLGTAMAASYLLHLPALARTIELAALAGAVEEDGVALRAYKPGSAYEEAGLVVLGNTVTLGMSEQSVIAKLDDIAEVLLHYERNARTALRERDATAFDDEAWRAYGLLTTSRRLAEAEAVTALTSLRMGVAEAIVPGVDYRRINRLLFRIQENHLLSDGPRLKSMGNCDTLEEARATLARSVMKGSL